MPKQTIAFVIDDGLTVDQTLIAFAETLKQADPLLSEILVPVLANLSQDIAVDQDQLLDALYAATAPGLAPTPGGADASETQVGEAQ